MTVNNTKHIKKEELIYMFTIVYINRCLVAF